ncbi:MAG: methyl-accepting chemotaxis protein [Rhodobacteraceae bacterium]|nr:methyl-accepting chemotaxis protein [Paracoccaceae bacterium]
MSLSVSESPQTPALADIVERTTQVKELTQSKVNQIRSITGRLRILALNAMIESQHAGDKGIGFSVVAQEVRGVSTEVEGISIDLAEELAGEIAALESLSILMSEQTQGARLVDLALNAIELIDRNLFERTCDVRWWATDSAIVDCAVKPTDEAVEYATQRLGVILDAYTVYTDLWLCDGQGCIIANGRPDQHQVRGLNVSDRPWFSRGMALSSGDDYVAEDIVSEPFLAGMQSGTYVASVREGGERTGKVLGVLAIHFDWESQAKTIVDGVRLSPEERERTRVMLLDSNQRVLASSDGKGILKDVFALETGGRDSGFYQDAAGAVVAFHRTPGYETYEGLGWHGVIQQRP